MNSYKALNKQIFSEGKYSIVPIRMQDRFSIMKWRNEQVFHLRQSKPLTEGEQDKYFNTIITPLFDQVQPVQLLFTYLDDERCIGYGGLVHINWTDKNAEISFLMDTALESLHFKKHWSTFLRLIEQAAFTSLNFHKIYTYAFDVREHLYEVLESCGYRQEAVLKEHCFYNEKFIDVVIHSKIRPALKLRVVNGDDIKLTFAWATDPSIRKYSFEKGEIGWSAHEQWFLNRVNDPLSEYFILVDDVNVALGSIRFDIEEGDTAKISFLIDSKFHGRGYGKLILDLGLKELQLVRPQIKSVYGLVINENVASMRVFEQLKFSKAETSYFQTRFIKFFTDDYRR